MISFLVLGDGFAGSRVAAAIASVPGAHLAAVACACPPVDGVFALPGGARVEAVEAAFLTQDAGIQWARRLGANWLLCINSTVILPAPLIELFGGRALNSHPGPLPEYAGLHAHQWALRNGATEYGATVHRMDARVDAGPIVASTRFPIRDDDTGLSLFRRAIGEAADLMASLVERIVAGEVLPSVPQDLSRRRLYRHHDALDGRIDWRLPARSIVNFVRAGNYEPFQSPTYVAHFDTPSGALIEVLRAELVGPTNQRAGSLVVIEREGPVIACGDGNAVRILRARNSGRIVDSAGWDRCLRCPPAAPP